MEFCCVNAIWDAKGPVRVVMNDVVVGTLQATCAMEKVFQMVGQAAAVNIEKGNNEKVVEYPDHNFNSPPDEDFKGINVNYMMANDKGLFNVRMLADEEDESTKVIKSMIEDLSRMLPLLAKQAFCVKGLGFKLKCDANRDNGVIGMKKIVLMEQ